MTRRAQLMLAGLCLLVGGVVALLGFWLLGASDPDPRSEPNPVGLVMMGAAVAGVLAGAAILVQQWRRR